MTKRIRIETVSARDLLVDPAVQRAEEASHVDRLAREWRSDYVGVLIASRRKDEKLYVLDGFQRLLAVRDRQGLTNYQFTVQVYEGLSLREEAEIFLAHNRGRKAVSPYGKFRVSLTAGDPVAVAVNDVVEGLGLSVGARSSTNVVGCVASLERIVGRRGRNIDDQKDILGWSLQTYRDVYGTTTDYWRSEVLEGLAAFYEKHANNPNFRQASLNKAISKVTIPQLIAAAKAKAIGSNRVSPQIAAVMEELYDRNKSTRRLVAV